MFYLIHRDQTNIKNYVLVYWSGQINGNFVYTEYAGVICLCKLESKYIVDVQVIKQGRTRVLPEE
jgi:phosphoketolase